MGNTNRDRKERNLLGDLPRGWPNPKPIPEDPPREPVARVKGVGGYEFDGARKALTFQDRFYLMNCQMDCHQWETFNIKLIWCRELAF
jgi:hypothetical protein